MSTLTARKFVLVKEFEGLPKLEDFKLAEETLPTDLLHGEILAKAEWLSVDPYMRIKYVDPVEIGDVMKGDQVARVMKSRCTEFPEGSQIVGNFGWRDLTVFKPDPKVPKYFLTYTPMPEMKGLPDSYALGCMGMPGNAAYHGLVELCHPKHGEVLVVSGAAGAVGSLVGQIGKIKGCTVFGFAGTQEKVDWLINDLGFDHAFNYKEVNYNEVFEKYAPNGVDIFFDNVGADIVAPVIRHMNNGGRICKSGSIATYNSNLGDPDPKSFPEFRQKKLKLSYLSSAALAPVWFEGIYKIRDWILEGKIKVRETIMEPFEKMPQAFIDLFTGKNVGKMIVKP